MKNILAIVYVLMAAFLEVAVLTVGGFTQYIDVVFITLFAISPYESGAREYILLVIGGLLLESVSVAPFGLKILILGICLFVGNFLLRNIFTRASIYSLALFSFSISLLFNFFMTLANIGSVLSYGQTSLRPSHIAFAIIVDAVFLFASLILKTKKQKRQYSFASH